MPKGDKFIALTAYLEKCGKDEIKLSFSEIKKYSDLGCRIQRINIQLNGQIRNLILWPLGGLMLGICQDMLIFQSRQ